MRFHWQNLNEGHRGFNGETPKGFPWEGRAWFYFGKKEESQINFEWSVGKAKLALRFDLDEENDGTFHIAIPFLGSFFLSFRPAFSSWLYSRLMPKYGGRSLGIQVHNWSIWWNGWNNDDEWCSKDPWWRRFSLNIPDLLLGRMDYSSRLLEKKTAAVPMPEGCYPCEIEIREDAWRRRRFPWKRRIIRAHCEMKIPIPHEGKGTAAWNCGDDAIYGMTCQAKSVADAVGEIVKSVYQSRDRYGDINREWPAPKLVGQAK